MFCFLFYSAESYAHQSEILNTELNRILTCGVFRCDQQSANSPHSLAFKWHYYEYLGFYCVKYVAKSVH